MITQRVKARVKDLHQLAHHQLLQLALPRAKEKDTRMTTHQKAKEPRAKEKGTLMATHQKERVWKAKEPRAKEKGTSSKPLSMPPFSMYGSR